MHTTSYYRLVLRSIQLIWTVGCLYTSPFLIVVYPSIWHRKGALLVNWTFQIKSYLPLTEHKGVFFCISGSCYTFFNLCSQFLKGNRITKNGTGPEKVCRVLYIYICVSSPFVRMSHSTQSVYAHHIFWGIYFSCFLGSFYQGSLIILPLNGKYFCPHSRHASFYNIRLVFKEK
jgi:hypothetical protein